MNMFDLSIVIVNFNTPELTKACIESVKKYTTSIKYEIVLIDNSKDNKGFTGGNNLGIKKSKGRYVLLLNSDTLIHDNVLGEMISWMDKQSLSLRDKKIGIASCALKNKDGSLQGTGGYFPTLLRVFSWMTIQDFPFVDKFILPFHPTKEKSFLKNEDFYKTEKELDWVTGAFFLIRKEVIDEIGGLDEEYFMYTEETDFCFRAKEKGWKVIYNPKWFITHFGGASSTGNEFSVMSEYKNIKLFYRKHYPKWQYPILRLMLKVGALGRIIVLGTVRGKEYAQIYAKAFKTA
jgi:GT2 family glycosyltransferase